MDKSFGQGLKQCRVDENAFGLIKITGLVLAARQIDADFSADAAVDLGNDCCWNLNKGDAPQEGRGCKAAQVTDDAAAKGDDIVTAGNSRIGQGLV